MKTYRGKCPRCCPDGGACFSSAYDYDSEKYVKQCNNCGHQLPFRKSPNRKPTGPNARQTRLVERLREAGWAVTVEMIGRKAFVKFDHPTRHWLAYGNSGCGTIGPNGALKLKLYRVGGDKEILDGWDFDHYLIKG